MKRLLVDMVQLEALTNFGERNMINYEYDPEVVAKQKVLQEAYEKHGDKVLLFLAKYTGSKKIANELFPDVKFRALERPHGLKYLDSGSAVFYLCFLAQQICEEKGERRGADLAVMAVG